RGNYDLAIQEYREYLRNYPNTDLSDNAQYWIGECYFSKGRYNEAVTAWDELMRDYPASDKLPDARYKKGVTLERLGRRRESLVEYRNVVERYPNSEAGRKAREKLNPYPAPASAPEPEDCTMASVIRVILFGNLGRDPEIRYTQGG